MIYQRGLGDAQRRFDRFISFNWLWYLLDSDGCSSACKCLDVIQMKQHERDLAMLDYWQQQKLDAERAVQTAQRQIEYLGQLLVQHSLEDKGMTYAEFRDADPTME